MYPNLSFEQAPPIHVPYRFFVTAPWFGTAAGLLLALVGSEMLESRWTPTALAATHLLVTGFMLQAMCGALLQFVPVAAGGNIWRPNWIANGVHPLLLAAALLLAGAFLKMQSEMFIAAAHAFALGLTAFGLVASIALWRTPAQGATVMALRMALIGLLVTMVLGILLAFGLAWEISLPLPELTDIHMAWGLGGWALTLLAGVSFFVVPMFQLTPAYPSWLARSMPWLLFAVLMLWSAQLVGYPKTVRDALAAAGLGIGAAFAISTLHLQNRRRRKVSDPTFLFFRTAMLSLLAVFISSLIPFAWPEAGKDPRLQVWLGVLALAGIFVSAISGMLYKIMPFLNWLHLQRLCGLKTQPPMMNRMISVRAMRQQFYLHLAALALLLMSVWFPEMARLAGLAFAANCCWLGINVAHIARTYGRFKGEFNNSL